MLSVPTNALINSKRTLGDFHQIRIRQHHGVWGTKGQPRKQEKQNGKWSSLAKDIDICSYHHLTQHFVLKILTDQYKEALPHVPVLHFQTSDCKLTCMIKVDKFFLIAYFLSPPQPISPYFFFPLCSWWVCFRIVVEFPFL